MAATEQFKIEQTPEERLDGGKASARLGSLDISRGWAILAVIFIHVTGHFLPALHPPKSLTPPSAVCRPLLFTPQRLCQCLKFRPGQ